MRYSALVWVVLLLAACTDENLVEHEGNVTRVSRGEQLFFQEQFGGNGRTCGTCHTRGTGTISTQEIRNQLLLGPTDPIFRAIDSDLGLGLTYTRLATTATFRVEIPLPPNVRLLDIPDARSVVLHRGAPTVFNTALDPVIMLDGRQPSLEAQVNGAVGGHFEPARFATKQESEEIADFERSLLSPLLASESFPQLPLGRTASEKRGREFFVDVFDGVSKRGVCAACHAGPMLNEITTTLDVANGIPCPVPQLGEDCPIRANPPAAPGSRFFTAFVSEFNDAVNPPHLWAFTEPDGTEKTIVSPDVGRALITGRFLDAELFKIPTLWGVARTAPYFHDGSAETLEELAEHYNRFITLAFVGGITLTTQDQADIVAFLRLL